MPPKAPRKSWFSRGGTKPAAEEPSQQGLASVPEPAVTKETAREAPASVQGVGGSGVPAADESFSSGAKGVIKPRRSSQSGIRSLLPHEDVKYSYVFEAPVALFAPDPPHERLVFDSIINGAMVTFMPASKGNGMLLMVCDRQNPNRAVYRIPISDDVTYSRLPNFMHSVTYHATNDLFPNMSRATFAMTFNRRSDEAAFVALCAHFFSSGNGSKKSAPASDSTMGKGISMDALPRGTPVWANTEQYSWVEAAVADQVDASTVQVDTSRAGRLSVNIKHLLARKADTVASSPSVSSSSSDAAGGGGGAMSIGEAALSQSDDLAHLHDLNEAILLSNLNKRYCAKPEPRIYTYTGPIIIAINPYTFLDPPCETDYQAKPRGANPPHLYAIGDMAYRQMMERSKPQSVVISGESGAGKTESTKVIMTYLCALSNPKDIPLAVGGHSSRGTSPTHSGGGGLETIETEHDVKKVMHTHNIHVGQSVDEIVCELREAGYDVREDQISGVKLSSGTRRRAVTLNPDSVLQVEKAKKDNMRSLSMAVRILKTNPVLEAFGNARTTRNDNSSRFGKLMVMIFNTAGKIVGARIEHYLLERSRIVQPGAGERGYHIFYQLCTGGKRLESPKMEVAPAEEMRYLHPPNDLSGLTIPGVDDHRAWNETIEAMSDVGISHEGVVGVQRVVTLCLLLGQLRFGESPSAASNTGRASVSYAKIMSRDVLESIAALAGVDESALEEGLTIRHRWAGKDEVVNELSVSESISSTDALAKLVYDRLFTWLVKQMNTFLRPAEGSIYGSLESHPLSIGVLDIFGFEVFKENGFEQLCINFCNERLQLFFNDHVFKLEQEEYNIEGVSSQCISYKDNQPCVDLLESRTGILALLDDSVAQNSTDGRFADQVTKIHIKHPNYTQSPKVVGKHFVVKHFAGDVCYMCDGMRQKNEDKPNSDLIRLIGSSSSVFLKELFSEECFKAKENGGPNSPAAAGGKKKKETVAFRFTQQLFDLTHQLKITDPHYVRCIKPNNNKQPLVFDPAMVMSQLNYCGVLDTLKIRQSGLPVRIPLAEFCSRFGYLVPRAHSAEQICLALTPWMGEQGDNWQLGHTKVFLRDASSQVLEHLLNVELGRMAERIQKVFRGHKQAKEYRRAKALFLTIQLKLRRFIKNCRRKRAERVRKAATKIQATRRGYVQRVKFSVVLDAERDRKIVQLTALRSSTREREKKLAVSEKILAAKQEDRQLQESIMKAKLLVHQNSLKKSGATRAALVSSLEKNRREKDEIEDPRLEDAQRENEQLTQQHAKVEAQMTTLFEDSEKIKGKTERASKLASRLQASSVDLQNEIDRQQHRITCLQEEIEAKSRDSGHFQGEHEALRARLAELTKQAAGIVGAIQKARREDADMLKGLATHPALEKEGELRKNKFMLMADREGAAYVEHMSHAVHERAGTIVVPQPLPDVRSTTHLKQSTNLLHMVESFRANSSPSQQQQPNSSPAKEGGAKGQHLSIVGSHHHALDDFRKFLDEKHSAHSSKLDLLAPSLSKGQQAFLDTVQHAKLNDQLSRVSSRARERAEDRKAALAASPAARDDTVRNKAASSPTAGKKLHAPQLEHTAEKSPAEHVSPKHHRQGEGVSSPSPSKQASKSEREAAEVAVRERKRLEQDAEDDKAKAAEQRASAEQEAKNLKAKHDADARSRRKKLETERQLLEEQEQRRKDDEAALEELEQQRRRQAEEEEAASVAKVLPDMALPPSADEPVSVNVKDVQDIKPEDRSPDSDAPVCVDPERREALSAHTADQVARFDSGPKTATGMRSEIQERMQRQAAKEHSSAADASEKNEKMAQAERTRAQLKARMKQRTKQVSVSKQV